MWPWTTLYFALLAGVFNYLWWQERAKRKYLETEPRYFVMRDGNLVHVFTMTDAIREASASDTVH